MTSTTLVFKPLHSSIGLPCQVEDGLAEKRAALAQALRDLAANPALLAVANITGFGPVDESAYRGVHDLLRAAGKSVHDIVPDGAEVRRLNQPYIDAR